MRIQKGGLIDRLMNKSSSWVHVDKVLRPNIKAAQQNIMSSKNPSVIV
jgi:hypothetical protein